MTLHLNPSGIYIPPPRHKSPLGPILVVLAVLTIIGGSLALVSQYGSWLP